MQTTHSQLPHSSSTSALNPSKNIIIEERFLLRRLLSKQTYYNIYEGVDLEASRFVTVYIKAVRDGSILAECGLPIFEEG